MNSTLRNMDVPPAPAELVAFMRPAQQNWARRGVRSRLSVLRDFRELLVKEAVSLAKQEGERSQRDPAEVMASELIPLADACRFLEREACRTLKPRSVGIPGRPWWLLGVRSEVIREAYGVVLVIAPSNYPLFLPGVQVLQALAAGNAVILKPGVGGRPAALGLLELFQKACLPGGLVALLAEDPGPAQMVIQSGVDKVFFTGSQETGAKVLSQLAARATPSAMELSGCDASVIRADADLAMAVRALVFGLRLNRGRTCIAPKRVFVARSIATEFEGRLAEALTREPIHLLEGATEVRLRPVVLQAMGAGAHLLSGSVNVNNTITLPLVLGGVRGSSRLLQEDFFAPVLSVVTVADDAEAIALTNQSPYALGASVFTRDERAGLNIARQLRAGVVLVNDMIAATADPRLPFGGRGASGFGSTRGTEGLLEMTLPKVLTVRRGRARFHFDPVREGDLELFAGLMSMSHAPGWIQRWSGLRRLIKALKKQHKKR